MLNAVLATVAAILWLSSYALFFAGDVVRWWNLRPYRVAISEMERLQAVRVYAAWVRAIPPAPPRPPAGVVMVPQAEHPPVSGVIAPYPGRRIGEG